MACLLSLCGIGLGRVLRQCHDLSFIAMSDTTSDLQIINLHRCTYKVACSASIPSTHHQLAAISTAKVTYNNPSTDSHSTQRRNYNATQYQKKSPQMSTSYYINDPKSTLFVGEFLLALMLLFVVALFIAVVVLLVLANKAPHNHTGQRLQPHQPRQLSPTTQI